MEEPKDRIRHIREQLGLSMESFAIKVGVKSKGTVNNWEKGIRFPKRYELIRIARLGRTSVDWIMTGVKDEDAPYYIPPTDYDKPLKLEYRVEASVPAGLAEIQDNSDWTEYEDLDYDPDDHFYLKVDKEFGYSMMPTVNPGDMVLVSISAKVKDGDLVAAKWDDTKGALKIYKEKAKKDVVLLSYNQAVDPIFLSKDEVQVYKVVLIKKKK